MSTDKDNCNFDSAQVTQCEQCAATFSSEAKLIRHLLCHTTIVPARCQLCNKNFSKQSRLAEHIMCVHAGVKRFVCSTCNARFSWRSTYLRHLRRQHGNGADDHPSTSATVPADDELMVQALQHECEHCSEAFAQRRELVKHVRQNHKAELREQARKVEQCAADKAHNFSPQLAQTTQIEQTSTSVLPQMLQVGQTSQVPQMFQIGQSSQIFQVTPMPQMQTAQVQQFISMPQQNIPLQVQVSLPIQPPFQCPMCNLVASDHATLAQHVGSHIYVASPPQMQTEMMQKSSQLHLPQSTIPMAALAHDSVVKLAAPKVHELSRQSNSPASLPAMHCPLCTISMPSRAALEQHVSSEHAQHHEGVDATLCAPSVTTVLPIQSLYSPSTDETLIDAKPFQLYFDDDDEPRVLLNL